MTHGYLFFLYTLMLYLTIKWHDKPGKRLSFFIGLILGIATICRPTEAVMMFIPILWKGPIGNKWKYLSVHKEMIYYCAIGLLVGMAPQFIYWKYATGHWIFDVGSKWNFLTPHLQVLFGWQKGWYIYTPLAILMSIGIYMIRKEKYYKAVLIYFLLNVWIITSWSIWQYGASYSARALIESYAVLSIPLAYVIQKLLLGKGKIIVYAISFFLLFVNLFQVWQYNNGILHYNDNNRIYYSHIFLNPHPTPAIMSLLDRNDYLRNEDRFERLEPFRSDTMMTINYSTDSTAQIIETTIDDLFKQHSNGKKWVFVSTEVLSAWGAFDSNAILCFKKNQTEKTKTCRLENALCEKDKWNTIQFYFKIPEDTGTLNLSAMTRTYQNIFLRNTQIIPLIEKS